MDDGVLWIAFVIGIPVLAVFVWRISIWAKRNPDPDYSKPNDDSGLSDEDWSDSIK